MKCKIPQEILLIVLCLSVLNSRNVIRANASVKCMSICNVGDGLSVQELEAAGSQIQQ